MTARGARALAAFVVLAAVGACAHEPAKAPNHTPAFDPELDGPIAEMKGIVPSRLTKEETSAKEAALDKAWKTLEANRARAVPRIEWELRELRASGRKDDFFAVDACGLLWEMAGADAAAEIAAALDGVDLGVHFAVVFRTFSAAAITRDERVLPLLRHALATDEKTGTFFFPEHFLEIGWPTTLDFMLAPFGPSLCDHLPLPAEPPADERVALSLLYLADKLACRSAPPALRRWARVAHGDVAKQVVVVLSHLGAPDDRDWFVSMATNDDAKTRKLAAYSLYEYGDPATTPTLRRLLGDAAVDVRLEAIAGIFHLIDEEGGRALIARRLDAAVSREERDKIDAMLALFAKDAAVEPAPLAAGAAGAWASAIRSYWKKRDGLFSPRPGDRTLDRPELLRALEHWEREGRLSFEAEDWTAWIEQRQVLSAAVPDDLPRLVAVRSAILHRHSDEALEEVQMVDRMIAVLRRRAAGAAKPNE